MLKRSRSIFIIISAVALLVVVGGILLFWYLTYDSNSDDIKPALFFYEADYSTDILSDPEYLKLNRAISYKNGAVMISVEPENYAETDKLLDFLAEFLNTAINGDYKSYPKYFTEEYKSKNDIPEKFTMQRIYNITIEKISESAEEYKGRTINQYVYMLDYMIKRNDGTLRKDIESDASIPQYLVIKEIDGELLIDNILTYSYK